MSTPGRRAAPFVSKDEARAFRQRWRRANEAERAELRATSPEQKLRQLSALMASVDAMGWREALADETDGVRQRWLRLRKAFHVR